MVETWWKEASSKLQDCFHHSNWGAGVFAGQCLQTPHHLDEEQRNWGQCAGRYGTEWELDTPRTSRTCSKVMESEWTELLLEPDILVLKEGSGFDVATVKKHDKLIKHFDGMHSSTRAPRRSSQHDGWLKDSKQSWTLHRTKLPYKVPYNEGWSWGTRLNSEQYRKCKNFTKHNSGRAPTGNLNLQGWTALDLLAEAQINFKRLHVSVLSDAWIDLYFTKKNPLFMAKGHFCKKVKHFSAKRPVCRFIVCSHNRVLTQPWRLLLHLFRCSMCYNPLFAFWSMYKYMKLNTICSNIILTRIESNNTLLDL